MTGMIPSCFTGHLSKKPQESCQTWLWTWTEMGEMYRFQKEEPNFNFWMLFGKSIFGSMNLRNGVGYKTMISVKNVYCLSNAKLDCALMKNNGKYVLWEKYWYVVYLDGSLSVINYERFLGSFVYELLNTVIGLVSEL